MTQGENLSLQVSTHSEGTSERPQQRKQDGHHRFGRLHGIARKFKGIKADRVFGRGQPEFWALVARLKVLAVGSKLKFLFFVESEMSGFKVVPSPIGLGWFWGWGCRGRGRFPFPCS